uniref:Metallothionein 2 n=1 Tax=Cystoderma carcharias TaxID=511157 RepID=A0A7U3V9I9_9AGAR|nr:metallothionein 2 [Cystoderma carcharias]
MFAITQTPVSQACGGTTCNCGASCACKPGECKC